MDKKTKKEIKDASRVFNGYWARLIKFGPEDNTELLKEAASDLINALRKIVDDDNKNKVDNEHP